jgi:uncharacterized protein (DUF1501 family)
VTRRTFLRALGLPVTASLLAPLLASSQAQGGDYRALVVLYLGGGNDGHNVLVPTDGLYTDYQAARQNLALPRNSLLPLTGSHIGHTFGLHPALQPLVPLFHQQRLQFIANVGALVRPCTAAQVLADAVEVPPFLFSHSDQTEIACGWIVSENPTGWAGRGLESLPEGLRHRNAAVTMGGMRTLVLGRRSPVSFMPVGGQRWWGYGDMANPQQSATQALLRMAQWQSRNDYEREYIRTLGQELEDSMYFTRLFAKAPTMQADFGPAGDPLVERLRGLASVLPLFKAEGLKRQVFLVDWGEFDTHANQRGSGRLTQDAQLARLAQALKAFDDSNRATGMDLQVTTLVMTEFGRTLRPGSGGGSEHAWGNHWWVMGGPVAGGGVTGVFPSPRLGGPDDSDPGQNGRHTPTLSIDQVAATLMQWLGLPSSRFAEVLPNLVNFPSATLPLLRA